MSRDRVNFSKTKIPLPFTLHFLSLFRWDRRFEKCDLLSVEKASAAARKPNIVSKCSGESTNRRQLRPITTLFPRAPVSFVSSTTLSTTATDTGVLEFGLRSRFSWSAVSVFPVTLTAGKPGGIDQQQQHQQSSLTVC